MICNFYGVTCHLHNHFGTYIRKADLKIPYSSFLCKDFNLANGLIRVIKIREVFIMLHFVFRLQ